MTTPDSASAAEIAASPLYHISFDQITLLKRSPITILAARRPSSSPSRLKEVHELSDPQSLVEEIAAYWHEDDDFIHAEMPMQEIVFRILLSRNNQPTQLSEIHHELTEKWATPIRPISISPEGLQRVLDNDTYYGFERVDE